MYVNKKNPKITASGGRGTMQVEAELSNGIASISIVTRISKFTDSSASVIRNLVSEAKKKKVSRAEIYINSAGGDVFEATEIINELKRGFSEVHITVGALAASATTRIIAEFKETTKAHPTSQFMIHKPKMTTEGDLNQVEAALKMLKNVTVDYKKAYAKAFNMTEEEIEALWANGDYWMTAKEAKQKGLIAEVIEDTLEFQKEDAALLTACGAPTIPQIKSETKNEKMDKNELIALLGLDADATDEQIKAAIKKLKEEAGKTTEALASAKAQKDATINAMVDAAIAAKKITADQKEVYVGLANADFEGTQKAINAMEGVNKVSGEITPGGGSADAYKDWTLEDYLDKDPEAYEMLKAEKPEVAAQLEKAYFNKK